MIVYCEKCNSKFQVDDAKIPDAGVKARCSVCSHSFVLRKEPVAPHTVPPVMPKIPQPPAPSAQEQPKPSGAAEFDASVFKEEAPVSTAATAQEQVADHSRQWPTGSARFSPGGSVEPAADATRVGVATEDVVVEIDDSNGFDEEENLHEAGGPGAESLSGALDRTPLAAGKPLSEYDAFTSFAERQKRAPDSGEGVPRTTQKPEDRFTSAESPSGFTAPAGREFTVAAETIAAPTPRFPEVISSGQLPANQVAGRQERGIVTMLDERGLSDDYVVQMVQEICHAVKYVEGVEKPDWQTRMMGLDMLCKIRGLYAAEKKEDPANRQLQIVAGINM